jgi:hypothetical protein
MFAQFPTVTFVVNNQFRMHSNTHLLQLVLVTRVVMVLEEAILALMVEVVLPVTPPAR